MKCISLTKGKFAIVDDEYFEELNSHKWHALKRRSTFYAVRDVPRSSPEWPANRSESWNSLTGYQK